MNRKFLFLAFILVAMPAFVMAAPEDETVKEEPRANSTMLADLIEKIKFKDESFGQDVSVGAVKGLDSMEEWRNKIATSLETPIEKVKESRKVAENMKSEIKAMSFLHLAGLQVLKFVFSVGVIFYSLVIILGLVVIKKLFAFLRWVFRRKAVQA